MDFCHHMASTDHGAVFFSKCEMDKTSAIIFMQLAIE
jgi:hypothetical protein